MATFTGSSGNDSINAVTGVISGFTPDTPADVALLQDASGDEFNPGNGADTIVAGSGDDTIYGSAGADDMAGGAGNDIFVYFSASDLAGDRIDGGAHTGSGDQIQLGFSGTADFSSQTVLSIEFLNLFGNVAHSLIFNGSQVGGSSLSTTLGIQGNTGADVITFNNISSFDISGFTFNVWDEAEDRIVINIGGFGGFVTGSSVADEINGGNGTDVMFGTLGADTLRGAFGNDEFRYTSQAQITGDSIDGGASGSANGDLIDVGFAGVADFTGATIASTGTTSIESIRTFTAGDHDFIFDASQIGGNGLSSTLILQSVSSNIDRLIINNVGGAFDISGFTFTSWNDPGDKVIISATSVGGNDILGTSVADEVNGGASFDLIHGTLGADTLRGGAGNDTFRYASASAIVNDSIDGGADNDTIQIMFAGTANFSTATFASSGTTSVETLTLQGSGNTDVFFNGSAVSATGLSSTLAITGTAFTDRIFFSNISGSFDISAFFFNTWTPGTDQIVLDGGSGAETIVGTGQDDIFNGSLGADSLGGGGGRDRFVYQSSADATGDTIDGGFTGVNLDTIEVKVSSITFSGATITSIEQLALSSGFGSEVTFAGSQLFDLSSNLAVEGDNSGADTITFNVGSGSPFFVNLSSFVLSNWETRDRFVINVTVAGTEVTGSVGNDTINGSTGNNIFNGNLGDDRINGGAARDQFTYTSNAAIGADTINGGNQNVVTGDELIIAFTGLADFRNATIASTGFSSIEFLDLSFGGAHDVLFNGVQFGGGGLSSVLKVEGNNGGADSITFDNSNALDLSGMQFVVWNDAVDRVTINGGSGGDALTGSLQSDSINGGTGSDTIAGGSGDDTIDGGGDADVLSFFTAGSGLVLALAASGNGAFTVAGLGTDTYTNIEGLGGSNNGADSLTGNSFANILLGHGGDDAVDGDGGDDSIAGGTGNDTLLGGFGNDTLNGGIGIDSMTGGAGDDVYLVDSSGDQVLEAIGGGSDQVSSSVSFVLASGQEVEKLGTFGSTSTGDINLTGNSFSQTITGNAGKNRLDGKSGADRMQGLAGDDIYLVDNAGDVVLEAVGGGNDQVATSVSFVLVSGQEIEKLATFGSASTGDINLTGNALRQTIIGNAGKNRLDGGGGGDTMIGFAGDDTYFVRNASDVLTEAVGGGSDQVSTSVSYILSSGQEIERLATFGSTTTGNINLTGNSFGQAITGNAGANIINGKEGADRLFGLTGADTFVFDTALAPTNIDFIADFNVADDTIRLENTIFTALTATGTLAAGAFWIGAAAANTTDRIIYNAGTGALSYDADGSGGAAAIRFATLSANLALTNADFVVI